MTPDEQRLEALERANEKRHSVAEANVKKALKAMLRGRERVSVNAVASRAGVSRTFIYSQPELLQSIKKASREGSHRLARPSTPANDENLRARLAEALDSVRVLREENAALKRKVESLTAALLEQSAR